MTETIANGRGAAVSRSAMPVTVSATALAQHLDRGRTYIRKLEAEGVLHRDGSGFRSSRAALPTCATLRRAAAIAVQ
jgi:hypothetical protein